MPFENTNDSLFFYYSPQHKEALARMSYVVQYRKMGLLLTGEYGIGKTFLSQILKAHLPKDKYLFVFLTNLRLDPLEFVREINRQLGEESQSPNLPKMDFLHSIRNRLQHYRDAGVYPVIVIDEAQSIKDEDLLEEIRLLFNIHSEDAILFTLFLLGQPMLEEKVDSIMPLRQRLSVRYRLNQFTEEETKEYINHRLHIAGAKRQIFMDAAYNEIYNLSQGLPRAINNICDLALLSGFFEKATMIDKDIIVHVGEDLKGPSKSIEKR